LDAGTRDCVDCDNDIRGLGGVDFWRFEGFGRGFGFGCVSTSIR
jgi:hypothetical protein